MNKNLIEALSLRASHKKAASAAVMDGLFGIISDVLAQGETVKLIDFGSFSIAEIKSRVGGNPQTGDVIQIPAGKRPKFTTGTKLIAAVNNCK